MLAAERLSVLEYLLQGSIVERGAQGAKVLEKRPRLVGGDTSFPFADEQ